MREWWLLVKEFSGVGAEAGASLLQKLQRALKRYTAFLKQVSMVLGIALGCLLLFFVIGIFSGSKEVRGASLFLMGITVIAWMLAAFPFILAARMGYEWGPVKKTFRLIGWIGLWFFFAAVYFHLVPVPAVLVLPMLILFGGLAYGFMAFGVPDLGARFVKARLGIAFTVITIILVLSSVFPSAIQGIGKLTVWINTSMDGAVEGVVKQLPQSVAYSQDLVFFDPRTQKTVIWYYKIGDKAYELYNAPGFHPRYSEKLKPVTPEIVREIENLEKEAKKEKDRKETEAKALAEKQAEEKRLVDLETAIKVAQAKADEAAKIARKPGPRGLAGQAGLQGPAGIGIPGPPGKPGEKGLQGPAPSMPEVRTVRIPEGTIFEVVLDQTISTERNLPGEVFRASLRNAVWAGGETIPVGTLLEGRVVELERPGKVRGAALLVLTLTKIHLDESSGEIETDAFHKEGEATKGEDAVKVGIGTAIGGIIGGIFGGREGAAQGAAVGAGGGTAAVVATRGKEIELAPETKLTFRLVRDAVIQAK